MEVVFDMLEDKYRIRPIPKSFIHTRNKGRYYLYKGVQQGFVRMYAGCNSRTVIIPRRRIDTDGSTLYEDYRNITLQDLLCIMKDLGCGSSI